MSKGLRNYPERERQEVIDRDRRLRSETKGIGYWAAWDARHGKRASAKVGQKTDQAKAE